MVLIRQEFCHLLQQKSHCIQMKLENKYLLKDQIWIWPQETPQIKRLASRNLLWKLPKSNTLGLQVFFSVILKYSWFFKFNLFQQIILISDGGCQLSPKRTRCPESPTRWWQCSPGASSIPTPPRRKAAPTNPDLRGIPGANTACRNRFLKPAPVMWVTEVAHLFSQKQNIWST